MSGLSILKFYAEWCGPCKALAPQLDELAKTHDVLIKPIDVEVDTEIKERYGVMSVPTVILVKDGEVVDRISGKLPIQVYEDKIVSNL